MSDYYEILGLNKDCSHDEIKTAFKKLAREHHPDKGGDKEKFQEIQKAYETLSDPEQRSEYDSPSPFGRSSFGRSDDGGFPFNFQNFFNEMNGFGGGGGGRQRKCNDHVYNCKITLRDIYFGITKTIKITRKRNCNLCKKNCSECEGSGMLRKMIQLGPIRQIIQQACGHCSGSGKIDNPNGKCKQCSGKNMIIEERLVEINIPKGSESEQQIRIEGWGEQPSQANQIPGDLIIVVTTVPDMHFKREGFDLVYSTKLTFTDSILGKTITIPHFSGKFEINTSQFGIINPNKRYTISKKGIVNKDNKTGNLYIQFDVIYPTRVLNTNELESLKQVFQNINFE